MVKFYKKSLALLALSTFPAFMIPGAVANSAGEAQDDRSSAVFSVVDDHAGEGNAEETTVIQVRRPSVKM